MQPPLLVSNLTNIHYLSGMTVSAGLMLLTRTKKILFVDHRYAEAARKQVRSGIEVQDVAQWKERVRRYRQVRFEAENVTVAQLQRWKKELRGTKFIASEGIIETMRRQKQAHEQRSIQKACAITDDVLSCIPSLLKEGVTEKQLAWNIESLARERGAESMAFDSIVAFGVHTALPHHHASNKKLQKGEIVQIDMGVTVDGYCSDCSRVFFTQKPTEKQQQVFDLLVNIVQITTKQSKVGTLNTSLDRTARDILKQHDYEQYFLHALGHGVGLDIHEQPTISSKAKHTKLRQHDVITIEPGVYFEGKWGMRIEDTVLVQKSAGKRMTKVEY